MAGGIAGGGIDDFGRAIGKGALHWGAIGHAARRVGVEGGFTLGGGAVGYAATGTMDGALMGASMGQAIGGAFGNFAVACFTAGTPLVVDREGNSRPIDEIEVGDFVLARSEFDPDGPLELKRVEEKFVRTSVVMDLVVHGQSIKTTAEHPFYVPAQGKFVAAGELQVGEQLVGHDGKLVQIESIGSTGEVTTVYNLRVADFHTYFVGGGLWGFDVWVHNASYLEGATYSRTGNAAVVRRNGEKIVYGKVSFTDATGKQTSNWQRIGGYQKSALRKEFDDRGRQDFITQFGSSAQADALVKKGVFSITDQDTMIFNGVLPNGWDVHHITPLFRGGDNSYENLIPLRRDFHQTYSNILHNYPDYVQPNSPQRLKWMQTKGQ
jgi:hypothetical protein